MTWFKTESKTWWDQSRKVEIVRSVAARLAKMKSLAARVGVEVLETMNCEIVLMRDGKRLRYWLNSGTASMGRTFRTELEPQEALFWLLHSAGDANARDILVAAA